MNDPFTTRLATGHISLGSWIQIASPENGEILADAGFEWLAVDCEHGVVGITELASVFRGIEARGSMPFARVTENSVMAIRRPLDAGARGIFVPLIHTPDDARRAVAAASYPPEGIRGFAFCRANGYGNRFAEYAANANDEVAVIVMIESREGVEQIAEILAVPGVDGAFIGPYDLSGSYGVTGKLDDPRVVEGCDRVVAACLAAGKAPGIHLVHPTPESIKETIARGYRLIALGMDTVFLSSGASRAIETADAVRRSSGE